MSATFKLGQILQRGDLTLNLQDSNSVPVNAYSITYDLYYVDPVGPPPGLEVLIPPSPRTPVNPVIGEYYASLAVPTSATPGTYRVRWSFQESSVAPVTEVVQEFQVVSNDTIVQTFTATQQACIRSLRILLRDNCVAGEEEIEIEAEGEKLVATMEELHEAIGDLKPDDIS